ncbi:MAG: hypothetical protein O7A08_07770, partial [SAR324 cluster bacterium]|nr:hypothetical protein [SAR324 cluster bacterium]
PHKVQALRVKITADPFAGTGARFRRLARQDEKKRNWHLALARWEAAVTAEEVLQEDPANGESRELVNAAYYAEGTRLQRQNKNVAAMKSLSRVDSGYQDTAERVEELQDLLKNQQAEMHYIAGVTFFLNEDLDNAIQEWERVLKMDPGHTQASKDLEIAKALQAKLSQIR